MFTQSTWSVAWIAIAAIAFTGNNGHAANPEAEEESAAEVAQHVYDGLLQQYRAGESSGVAQIELLNNWSKRIMAAGLGPTGLAIGLPNEETVKSSIQAHQTRMQRLERIVEARYKANEALAAELNAAHYFHLEAKHIEESITAVRQLAQPLEGDFDIKMPTFGEPQPLVANPQTIVLDIDASGKVSIEGKPLTTEQLEKHLKKSAKDDATSVAVNIRAHPDCAYVNVLRAISVCTKSGITSITFISKDKEAGGATE